MKSFYHTHFLESEAFAGEVLVPGETLVLGLDIGSLLSFTLKTFLFIEDFYKKNITFT